MASPCLERKSDMKKIFIPLLCLLFVLCMAFPALAEEAPEATSAPVTVTETPAEAETTEAPPTVTDESTVSEISDILKEWVPEILSAAALAFSAFITYLFKKGLLPGVTRALSKIDGNVEQYNAAIGKLVGDIADELKLSKEQNEALLAKFTVTEEQVASTMSVASKILLAQSESLFELLEHTNLPADVKAEIAATHKAQMAEIAQLMGGEGHEE